MRPDSAPAIRLEDYRPPAYRIDTVCLDVRLSPSATEVRAVLKISPADGTAGAAPLVLDGDGLDLTGLFLNGEPVSDGDYKVTPDRLELITPPAGSFELTIDTRLDPDANTTLMGLYRSSGTYCTQCEAEGFRRITYFLDRPDVLSVYTTRLEAPKAEAPVLLANGNPVETGDVPGTDRHYAIWHDPFPKPAYLFALVAGDLARVSDRFITVSGRPVDLNIFVEPGKEHLCDWAMDSLKRSMRWDEQAFGREYDLDVFNILAVSDFNMGAMENKGLNIFNDKYVLADPETATDSDYANVEAVIAHEYFHNWTGNRITCRDWFQLCLKEGLTVYRDQEFSADMRSRPVKRIADVRLLKSHQFPEDAGPLAHPVRPRSYHEINNFYTATVYEKGAEVVRMLHTLLGADGFRKGLDLYFDRHDGDATTIEAFLACFAESSGVDLSQFALWYEQAGTPMVTATCTHDPKAKSLTVTLSQELPPAPDQAASRPAVIPLRFGIVGANGDDMSFDSVSGARVEGDVLVLDRARQKVTFTGIAGTPVLSLLRGFSAPVRLNQALASDDLLFLARRDNDPFNRWQSLQSLVMKEVIRLTRAPADTPDARLVDVLGDILIDDSLDPAFRALALTLPGESDIAQEIGKNVDPDAVHLARTALRRAVAACHADRLAATLDSCAGSGAFSPDAAEAGRRALANQALSYAALTDGGAAAELLWGRFAAADNMTDRIAALTLLVHEDFADAGKALEQFRDRHQTSALAMDKWFMAQATAPLPGTLDMVRSLTAHPLYDWSNPNRVRALLQSFATGNATQFARADGAGFRFIAESVLAIDKRNPQVASRLLTSFRSWRALDPQRSSHAEAALLLISSCEDLSRDSRDIVDRTLR